jgi:hypothetical protein
MFLSIDQIPKLLLADRFPAWSMPYSTNSYILLTRSFGRPCRLLCQVAWTGFRSPGWSCKLAKILSNTHRNRLSCLGVNIGSSVGTLGWHDTLDYVGINASIQCAGLA